MTKVTDGARIWTDSIEAQFGAGVAQAVIPLASELNSADDVLDNDEAANAENRLRQLAAKGLRGTALVDAFRTWASPAVVKVDANGNAVETVARGDKREGTAKGKLVNGRREGEWVTTTKDGGVTLETYRNGVLEGPASLSRPDGSSWAATYKNGQIVGDRTIRLSNGHTLYQPYSGGDIHGHYREYDANNNLVREGDYVHGVARGVWTEYLPNGAIKKTTQM